MLKPFTYWSDFAGSVALTECLEADSVILLYKLEDYRIITWKSVNNLLAKEACLL